VIDVRSDASKRKWTYKITSSVVLEMNINQVETGNFNITGSLTKSVWRAFI
jgi:capping protein beta